MQTQLLTNLRCGLTKDPVCSEEETTRRRNEITSTILNALKTPNRPVQGETLTFTGTKIAENAAYIPVANILATSESLIKEYDRLDTMITDMRGEEAELAAETWQQEIHEAERQLKMGARVALRNVKKVLGVDMENEGKGATDGDGDEEMEDVDAGKGLNYELQRSLRYAERGVKRMVKGLPDDEV